MVGYVLLFDVLASSVTGYDQPPVG